jgi:hypothetical protein
MESRIGQGIHNHEGREVTRRFGLKLKLKTFASVSPKARTEDEHRVDSSQQRCYLSPRPARRVGDALLA